VNNPFGWVLGYLWTIAARLHYRLHPEGGSIWMPRWIQPYWMRCVGLEVSDALLEYYRRNS
jgi:hypothetical protein